MSFAIPVHRLYETKSLMAFYHPRPSYPTHIVLVPKRDIPNLMALGEDDTDFMADLVRAVQHLVRELGLAESGYRLICNGGEYQDIPHLHFHLVAG
jgi:histidine triad (HIT) family protein